MAHPFKLTELQRILLDTAARRTDGSLLPPPERVGDQGARIRKAIPPLLKHALVEEAAVTDANCSWRQDGDSYLGLLITSAGRAEIAVNVSDEAEGPGALPAAAPIVDTPAPAISKIAMVTELLRRSDGASLAELVERTGWLPHTMRAALTGLRKKGHAITRSGATGATRYHLAA